MRAPIEIVDYDPAWPSIFREISHTLKTALGSYAQGVEHVGSTAVPGLAAKPIIDIDVVIRDTADFSPARAALEEIGYQHEGDLGIAGREAFRAPGGMAPHHLYVCVAAGAELTRHIAFRDWLRQRADVAKAYADLKRDLAAAVHGDRSAYVAGKTAFIETQLQLAAVRNIANK